MATLILGIVLLVAAFGAHANGPAQDDRTVTEAQGAAAPSPMPGSSHGLVHVGVIVGRKQPFRALLRLDVHRKLMACGRDAIIAEGREEVRRAWPGIVRVLSQRGAAR